MKREFWRDRRVFVTGHTGFKGSWLTRWLQRLGAQVTGYALAPPTTPSLFDDAKIGEGIVSIANDVRDLGALRAAIADAKPEVVIHMAAQSLVRASYEAPVETYEVNVIGTVNVLEAVRGTDSVRSVVVVTSDKCYDNREWSWPYRESEPLGGRDPYSSSKACAELVAAAYRASFFPNIATVRAGNVIGGGDWAKDRLVPDLMRAFSAGEPALIRNPGATRPWQFVLDPMAGYLSIAEALYDGTGLAEAWNFGPSDADVHPVHWIADRAAEMWGDGAAWKTDERSSPSEAFTLKLDSSRARQIVGWSPRIDLETALAWTVEWHREWLADPDNAGRMLDEQIDRFEALGG